MCELGELVLEVVKKIRSKRAKTKRPRASMVATMLRRVGGIPTCLDFMRL